jgi:hypothetical protein
MVSMTSQQFPVWLAVFSTATRQSHTTEELVAFMHSHIADKRPDVGRMLIGHEAYLALTGHDLHDKSVDGVNAFRVASMADRRAEFPYNAHKVKLFAEMYEGAALLHSKKTFLDAYLNGQTTSTRGWMNREEASFHTLAKFPYFHVAAQVDIQHGVEFSIEHRRASSLIRHHLKTIKLSSQPVAFVVKQDVRFNLPKDFEFNGMKVTWQELERKTGITLGHFEAQSLIADNPMTALQEAYRETHSQQVQEYYAVDFSDVLE